MVSRDLGKVWELLGWCSGERLAGESIRGAPIRRHLLATPWRMWKLYCLALLHCSFTSRPAGCGKLLWFGLASLLQQPSPDSSRLWETIAGPHYLRALLNKTVPLMMGHSDWEARMKEMKWLSLPAATIAGQALLLQSLLSSWGTFLICCDWPHLHAWISSVCMDCWFFDISKWELCSSTVGTLQWISNIMNNP